MTGAVEDLGASALGLALHRSAQTSHFVSLTISPLVVTRSRGERLPHWAQRPSRFHCSRFALTWSAWPWLHRWHCFRPGSAAALRHFTQMPAAARSS